MGPLWYENFKNRKMKIKGGSNEESDINFSIS